MKADTKLNCGQRNANDKAAAVFNPERLVGLWNMIRFYASYFHSCLGRLSDPAMRVCRAAVARGQGSQLESDEAQEVLGVLDELAKQCKLLELEKPMA